MAGFNIAASLSIAAPKNLNQVIGQIKGALKDINVNVNLQIPNDASRKLNILESGVRNLNLVIKELNETSRSATANLRGLLGSAGNKPFESVATSANNARKEINKTKDSIEEFGTTAGLAARRFVGFSLVANSFTSLTSGITEAVKAALVFEREFIKVEQLGGATKKQLKELNDEITKLATSFGVASSDLIGATVTLRQAGLTAEDTKLALEGLAKTTLAPNFDNLKETTEGLIATYQQFRIEAKDTEKALGSINAVAGAFAVESKDIISAIQRAGGAFRSTGGDLNEFVSIFTSVRQTTRESAESIATGLRTIFARLQRKDTIDSLRDLQVNLRFTREEAQALGNAGLEQQFVGGFEAVKRLSQAVRDIPSTDPRYTEIVELLGGYRQISRVLPLLQEFSVTQKALNIAQAGSISLTTQAEQAQSTFIVRLQKVREEFLALFRTFVGSNAFQAGLDIFITFASAASRLLNAIQPLVPVLTALAAIKIGQNIGSFIGGTVAGLGGRSPQRVNTGGRIGGRGNGDTVPALLTPGEFVMRKDAAKQIGYDQLYNANRNPQKFASGGIAGFAGATGGASLTKNELEFLKRLSSLDNDTATKLIEQNRGVLERKFGKGNATGITGRASLFSAYGFNESSLRETLKASEANKAFDKLQEQALISGKAGFREQKKDGSVSKKLILPLGTENFGYLASKVSGEAGKQGRGSLAAGQRVYSGNVSALGVNEATKSTLKAAGIDSVAAGVNVYVLGNQPNQEFKSKIVGEVTKNINDIYNREFGTRNRPVKEDQVDTIAGYLFEKFVEGKSGQFVGKSQEGFEYSNRSQIGRVGKSFKGFITPEPLVADYLDLKLSADRGNTKDVVRKYLNEKQKDTGLAKNTLVKKFARGGVVPGTGNGDTVPAMLEPGEFVIKKSSAQAIGYDQLANANRYAAGGIVQKFGKGSKLGDEIDLTGVPSTKIKKVGILYLQDGIKLDGIQRTTVKNLDSPAAKNILEDLATKKYGNTPYTEFEEKFKNTPLKLRIASDKVNLEDQTEQFDNVIKSAIAKIANNIGNNLSDTKAFRGVNAASVNKEIYEKVVTSQALGKIFEGAVQTAIRTKTIETGADFDLFPTDSNKVASTLGAKNLSGIFSDVKFNSSESSKNSLFGKTIRQFPNRIKLAAGGDPLDALFAQLGLPVKGSSTPTVSQPSPISRLPNSAKLSEQALTKINLGEKNSIFQYTRDSRSLNDNLRSGNLSPLEEVVSGKIDSGISKSRVPKGIVTYRGIGPTYLEKIGFNPRNPKAFIGKEITDSAFTSTSIDENVARRFASSQGIVFKIPVPKGTKGIFNEKFSKFPEEKELLLGKNFRFRVTNINDSPPFLADAVKFAAGGFARYKRSEFDSLGSQPRESILDQYSGDSTFFNASLRNDNANKKTAKLEKTINQKLPKDSILYRGVNEQIADYYAALAGVKDIFSKDAVGKSFIDKGFLSTTADPRVTGSYVDGLGSGKMRLLAKAGTAARFISGGNSEVLFPPGRTIKINKVNEAKRLLEAELFASGGNAEGTDKIPALLTPGEFVINKQSAKSIGRSNLEIMNNQGVMKFQTGGTVPGANIPEGQFTVNQLGKILKDFGVSAGLAAKAVNTLSLSLITSSEDIKAKLVTIPDDFKRKFNLINDTRSRVNAGENVLGVPKDKGEALKFLKQQEAKLVDEFIKSTEATGSQLKTKIADAKKPPEEKKTSFLERFSGVGGLLATTGALQGAEFLNRNAGVASDVVRGGNENFFSGQKGLSGALGGAVTGGATLSFLGPIGVAFGSLAGAAIGAASSLSEAAKEIREAKIEKSIEDFGKNLAKINDPNFKGNRNEAISSAQVNQREALSGIRESAVANNSRLFGFLGVNSQGARAEEQKQIRQQFGSQLPDIQAFIGSEASKVAFANRGQFEGKSGKDLESALSSLDTAILDSSNGFVREQVALVAKIRNISFQEAFDETIKKARFDKIIEERLKDVNRSVAVESGRDLSRISEFVKVIDNAAASLSKLNASLDSFASVLDGRVTATKFNVNENAFKRNTGTEFNQAVNQSAGLFGTQGKFIKEIGDSISSVSDVIDVAISSAAKGGQLTGPEFTSKLIPAIEQQLKSRQGGTVTPEQQKRLREIESRSLGLDREKIIEGVGSGTLSKTLTEDVQRFIDGIAQITKQTESVLNSYGEAVAANVERQRRLTEEYDKLNQITNQNTANIVRRNLRQSGLSEDRAVAQLLPLQETAFQAKQASLTGNRLGVDDVTNPAAIGAAFNDVVKQIEDAEKNLNKVNASADEKLAGIKNITNLKSEAANLQQALKNLTNTAERSSAINERLNQIQREREARENAVVGFLEQDRAGQAKIGVQLGQVAQAQEFVKQGGNINDLPDEVRKNILGVLRQFADIRLPGLGNKTGKEITSDLVGSVKVGGQQVAGLPADVKNEQNKLNEELDRIFKDAEKAQKDIIKLQENGIDKLDQTLTANYKAFLSELETKLLDIERQKLRTQIDSSNIKSAELKPRAELETKLGKIGIKNQDQVDILKTTLPALEKRKAEFAELDKLNNSDNINKLGLEANQKSLEFRNNNFLASPKGTAEGIRDQLKTSLDNSGFSKFSDKILDEFQSKFTTGSVASEELKSAIQTILAKENQTSSDQANKALTRLQDSGKFEPGVGENALKQLQSNPEYAKALQSFDNGANKFGENTKQLTALTTEITKLTTALNNIPKNVPVDASTTATPFASGGRVFKPRGTDTVPAMLTPGEFVVNADSTKKNRATLEEINSGKTLYRAEGGLTDTEALQKKIQEAKAKKQREQEQGFRDAQLAGYEANEANKARTSPSGVAFSRNPTDFSSGATVSYNPKAARQLSGGGVNTIRAPGLAKAVAERNLALTNPRAYIALKKQQKKQFTNDPLNEVGPATGIPQVLPNPAPALAGPPVPGGNLREATLPSGSITKVPVNDLRTPEGRDRANTPISDNTGYPRTPDTPQSGASAPATIDFTTFNAAAIKLAEALGKIPEKFSGEFKHEVNINVTGAEVFAGLQPQIEDLVVSKVQEQLVAKGFKNTQVPEVG